MVMCTSDWNSRMLNEFNYTKVSGYDKGGDFENMCNEILDFQTHRYEVCLQEMMITIGAWDNVRVGANSITVFTKTFTVPNIAFVKPGAYQTIKQLVVAINAGLSAESDRYYTPRSDAIPVDVYA